MHRPQGICPLRMNLLILPIKIVGNIKYFWYYYVHNAIKELYAGLWVCGEELLNADDLRAVVSWPRAHSWRVPSRTPPADWPPPLHSYHGVCCRLVTSGSPQGEVSDRQRNVDEDQKDTEGDKSIWGFQ